jgi:hypothetical protein
LNGWDFFILSAGADGDTVVAKGYDHYNVEYKVPLEDGTPEPLPGVLKPGDSRLWVKVDEGPTEFIAVMMYPEDY